MISIHLGQAYDLRDDMVILTVSPLRPPTPSFEAILLHDRNSIIFLIMGLLDALRILYSLFSSATLYARL